MYKRTIWQDHVEGIQDGTDMNAANFNNLEAGVMEAAALAALNAAISRYSADTAKNAEVICKEVSFIKMNGAVMGNAVPLQGAAARNTDNYKVVAEIVDAPDGTVGDIIITEKNKGYFKFEVNGTATEGVINFYISGGMI